MQPTVVSTNMGTDNDNSSPPLTPQNPVPPGHFSASFERLIRENDMADWASAFTLFGECNPMPIIRGVRWLIILRACWTDTLETFFDARIDLIQRTLTKHSDRLKTRAEVAMNKMKSPSGEDLAENLDREMQKFKLKVCMSIISHPGVFPDYHDGWPRLFVRGVGSTTVDEALLDVAFDEGCSD